MIAERVIFYMFEDMMNRNSLIIHRLVLLAALLLIVSLLHYFTPTEIPLLHQVYRRLYYIPILFAAYWFGPKGGLFTALISTLLYLPHILFQWRHPPAASAGQGQYGEIIMFYVLGLIIGILAERERNLLTKQQAAARELELAYRKLQDSMEQIRRADRLSAVGQLSAGIAHEIRNPLASIKGAVDLLMDELPEEHPSKEYVDIVNKETARLQRLLEDFLVYARPSAPSFGAVRLQILVTQLLRLLDKEAERRSVKIDSMVPDDLPSVRADESQLFQVLVNLLLNSLQATGEGGTVHIVVGAGTDENVLQLRVEDNGPGIPESEMEKLFDPFYTTRDEGTGLGLSVVYAIIESHEGSINAANRPEGGAVFTLTLPVWTEDQVNE